MSSALPITGFAIIEAATLEEATDSRRPFRTAQVAAVSDVSGGTAHLARQLLDTIHLIAWRARSDLFQGPFDRAARGNSAVLGLHGRGQGQARRRHQRDHTSATAARTQPGGPRTR